MVLESTATETRYIRLRENAPNIDLNIELNAENYKYSENLEDKAYSFATDKHGFLKPSLVHENADLTLAFIGGSTTECMLVDPEKRFPHLSGELLSNDAFKVNTVNAGVSGNDSLNSINAFLNKVVPVKPDIAILMHNINDISILIHEGSYWNDNEFRSPIVKEDKSLKSFIKIAFPNMFELLFRLKAIFTGEIDEFKNDRDQKKIIDKERFYRLFKENLEIFVSIAKSKGIQPVLMTQASRFTENPDPLILDKFKNLENLGIEYVEFKTLYDGMNDQIRKTAADNKITLIDLAKEIPPRNDYIVDSVHFNNQGSELAAKVISEKLSKIGTVINAKNN